MANLLGAIGNAKPVTEFINTAGQYQQTQGNLETQRLQQQRLQAEALQAEKDNREYHVDAAITAFPEDHRDTIKKMWQMSGLVSPDGIMRGRDIRSTPELYKKYPDMALATNMTEIEKLEKEQASLAKKGDAVSQAKILENAATLTDLHRKNAFLRGKEKADEGFTLGEGQKRYDASGKEIAVNPPKPEEQWSDPAPMVIDGKTVMTQKSSKTGQIRTVAQGQTTNVNVDVDMGLSKGARAKAEEDVQEATDMYRGLENLVAISKPEFFTYAGRLQAAGERLGEKAKIVKDPKFLKDYSSWKVGTEQEFNKYRKWATGVAAGEKELQRIEGSFPNINMSKTEYMSALQLTAVNAWKLAERRRRALAAGVMSTDPEAMKNFYRSIPLDSPSLTPPDDILKRFSPKSKFEIIGVE